MILWLLFLLPTLLASPSLVEADLLFKARSVEKNARAALSIYRQLLEQNPTDPKLVERTAMACQFVGMRFGGTPEEKQALFQAGREISARAIAAHPDCAPCFFWSAINSALYGESVSMFKTIYLLKQIHTHLKRSAELDPTYAYGGAYRVLGVISNKLPWVLGGSDGDARDYFTRAIAASPQSPLNYLFLAKLLADSYGDEAQSQKIALQGLAQPKPDASDVEAAESYVELSAMVQLRRDLATKPTGASNP